MDFVRCKECAVDSRRVQKMLSLVKVGRGAADAMVIVHGQTGEPWLAGVTIKQSRTYVAYRKVIDADIDCHSPI